MFQENTSWYCNWLIVKWYGSFAYNTRTILCISSDEYQAPWWSQTNIRQNIIMKQLNIPKCLHVSIQGKDFITSHSFAFISFFLYVFSHCLLLQKYYYEDLSISIRLHYFTFDYKLSLRIEYYHILNHNVAICTCS